MHLCLLSGGRIMKIDRLGARLSRVMKPEFIAEWHSTPNDAFDGLKALGVIERGEAAASEARFPTRSRASRAEHGPVKQ
jgi:hypothetical protein